MRKLKLIAASIVLVCALAAFVIINAQPKPTTSVYTTDDLIAAYESGQYRAFRTNGRWLTVSPDKAYIYAHEDGIYRISDGSLFAPFDKALFSPDGLYVAQPGDGVYRLSDIERIIPTIYKSVAISHFVDGGLEHRTWAIIGDIQFSENGEYVAVTGDGVYRLRDRQKIVDTSEQQILHSESLKINFSADSAAVSTSSGVFRLSDGQQLFQTGAEFSPDGAHILTTAGILRLSDGKVFDILGETSFTPDMQYAVLPGDGVYRLRDGQRLYDLPQFAEVFTRPTYSPDQQYMAVDSNGLYHIRGGEKLSDSSSVIFSPDNLHVAIGQDGVYRLRDMQKLFDLTSPIHGFSHFSSDGAYLAVSDAIIRIADGQKLFSTGSSSTFSPNAQYVTFNDNGLYRLSDQQKQFEIVGSVHSFSPDGAYISVYDRDTWGIYRIRDGKYYPGLQFLDVAAGIMQVGNTALVIESS